MFRFGVSMKFIQRTSIITAIGDEMKTPLDILQVYHTLFQPLTHPLKSSTRQDRTQFDARW